MAKAPKLNEEVEVTLEVQAYRDAPGTTATIELPQAARVVRGDPRWQGDVQVNRPVRLVVTIVFERTGEYTIRGKALRPAGAGMVWGDADEVYLTVKQDSGAFGFESGGQTQITALPIPE